MFTFKNIKDRVEGNTKVDTPQVSGVDSSITPSNNAQVSQQASKTQPTTSDTFSTRDYLTRNTMTYDTGNLGDVYGKEQSRMTDDSKKLQDYENRSFGASVGQTKVTDVPTNTYGGAIAAKRVSKDYDILDGYRATRGDAYEYAMPDTPDFNAYNKALQDLAYQKSLANVYSAGSEGIEAQNTQQVYDNLANVDSRANLLRDTYGKDVNAYTQGMGALDSALAERGGFDNRGLQQASANTAELRGREQANLGGLRDSNLQAQRERLMELTGRTDDIIDDQQRVTDAYGRDVADYQANVQRESMAESDFIQRERATELERREMAREAKRQEDARLLREEEERKAQETNQAMRDAQEALDKKAFDEAKALEAQEEAKRIQEEADAKAEEEWQAKVKEYDDGQAKIAAEKQAKIDVLTSKMNVEKLIVQNKIDEINRNMAGQPSFAQAIMKLGIMEYEKQLAAIDADYKTKLAAVK